jgi:sensor histidine kinase YesM
MSPAVLPSHQRSSSSGWTLVLGIVLIVLSSAAPFIRFGDSSISIGARDIVNALAFTAAWLPFLLAAVLLLRIPAATRLHGSPWLLALCVVLLPVVAHLHTLLYFRIDAALNGPANTGSLTIPYLILTVLGALQYLTVVALFVTDHAARSANRAHIAAADLQVSHARMQQELTASKLAMLQAQLQPHFLFNTLNSVSALVTADPSAARRMLIDLSALLRMVLDSYEHPLVTVDEEMEMVRAYLAIQQVRFGDRLTFDLVVDADSRRLLVPPMLLQPLVENAVHHAMTSDDSDVQVFVRTSVEGGRLILDVTNTGPSPFDDGRTITEGVGLRNTRQRLQQLFSGSAALSLTPRTEGNGVTARIELPATTDRRETMLPDTVHA